MDSLRKRMRINVEGNDRLSNLPDDLLCKILSRIDVKQAIETSVLSSRWRFIWTSMPFVNISNEGFSTLLKFSKYLTHVLSSCDNQAKVSLSLHGKVNQTFVQRILKKAFSHDVQQLTFWVVPEKRNEVPLSIFSSTSLKHLTILESHSHPTLIYTSLTSTWELPALRTLHLENVVFYDDNTLFSKCANLKNLTLNRFHIEGSRLNSYTIRHPQLSSLTLKRRSTIILVNVVAPKLKNLTIIDCFGEHTISAPALTSLLFRNDYLDFFLDTDSLPSLENLGIYIRYPSKADAHKVIDLLPKFKNVKFVTLCSEIIELLESSVELIACQPSPFVNLTRITIYQELRKGLFVEPPRKVTMSTIVKNYLLDSSPRATLKMVSCEEIRVARDTTSAQDLMAELRVLLDQEKVPMEKREENMRPPEWCWDDLNDQLMQAKKKTCHMLKLLNGIECLLNNLPTSKRAKMLPCFSSLRAEADTVIDRIIKCMKIECDAKGRSLLLYIHKLTTTA